MSIAQASAARRALTVKQAGVLVAAATGAVAVLVVLQVHGTGDYVTQGALAGDNPAPAITALIHGDFSRLVREQPLMGLVSILVRAPVAAVSDHDRTAYQLGAIACLLPVAALFGWLVGGAAPTPRARLGAGLGGVLILLAPATRDALSSGHPEEVLAAVLATASVIAANRQAGVLAGVLLGLAVGTKQWALIAAPPVFVALDAGRRRAGLIAGAIAVVMSAPAVLDPSAFARRRDLVFGTHLSNPFSAWWSLGAPFALPHGLGVTTVTRLPLGLTRGTASLVPLVVAIVVLLCARRPRRTRPVDPLAMLALLALVRCVADPLPLSYYYVPVFLALAAYETVTLARPPLLAACAVVAESAVFGISLDPPLVNALVLVSATLLAAYLVRGSVRLASVSTTTAPTDG